MKYGFFNAKSLSSEEKQTKKKLGWYSKGGRYSKTLHSVERSEKLHQIRLVGGGEGKVKAEFKGWVNFCESREG